MCKLNDDINLIFRLMWCWNFEAVRNKGHDALVTLI